MISALVFAVAAVSLVASEWIASRRDPDASATSLFDRTMQTRTARVAILVCWWWIGWHVLVAQTVDPSRIGPQ